MAPLRKICFIIVVIIITAWPHARRIIAHLHHLIAMLNSRSLLRIIDSWRFDIIMTVWWGAAAVRDLIRVSLVCGGIEMQQAHFGQCSKQSL